MKYELEDMLIEQILSQAAKDDPLGFLLSFNKSGELVESLMSGYHHFFTNHDGELLIRGFNNDIEPKTHSQHSAIEINFSELAKGYLESASGNFPRNDMKNHIKQLRLFADKIETILAGKQSNE